MEPTAKMLTEARKVLEPLENWHHNCHGASFAIVNAELWTCRLARGVCKGVGAQHSWVVLGKDCYDPEAAIIDPLGPLDRAGWARLANVRWSRSTSSAC